jgi:hypothetical protein
MTFAGSRRGTVQIVQGSAVSTLPHVVQTRTYSTASAMACANGWSNCSFYLMSWRAARRAERGPSPGTLARSWIRRWISGPAIRLDMAVTAVGSRQSGTETDCRLPTTE